MRFTATRVRGIVASVAVIATFVPLESSGSRVTGVPVQIRVGDHGTLTVAAMPDRAATRSMVQTPLMIGIRGASAYYMAFSRRGQTIGAELLQSQAEIGGRVNETVVTLTGALVHGQLVLHRQGQHAAPANSIWLRGHGNGVMVMGVAGGRIQLQPGRLQDFTRLQQQARLRPHEAG